MDYRNTETRLLKRVPAWFLGAGDEARTRDLRLGKPTLYQLSYARVPPILLRPPPAHGTFTPAA